MSGKYVIFGATGSIGSSLAEKLANEKYDIHLVARNQDDKEAIKRRMLAYSKDISHKKDYDYVLINDNVENCFNELKKIVSKHLN